MNETVTLSAQDAATVNKLYKASLLANGLAAVGSAAGLIYGITAKKRWWLVLLLMIGGATAGRGVGYVLDSVGTKKIVDEGQSL